MAQASKQDVMEQAPRKVTRGGCTILDEDDIDAALRPDFLKL